MADKCEKGSKRMGGMCMWALPFACVAVDGQSLSDSFWICPWGFATVAQAGGEKGNDQHELIPTQELGLENLSILLGWAG